MRFPRVPIVLLVTSSFLLAGCHAPSDPDEMGTDPYENGWRTLALGQYSREQAGTREMIRDPAAWSAFWTGHAPNSTLPVVDFERETVIAVVLEDRPNGCHQVRVRSYSVNYYDGSREFEVTEFVPGDDVVCTDAITQPNHIIAVMGRFPQVSFVDRVVEGTPPA